MDLKDRPFVGVLVGYGAASMVCLGLSRAYIFVMMFITTVSIVVRTWADTYYTHGRRIFILCVGLMGVKDYCK